MPSTSQQSEFNSSRRIWVLTFFSLTLLLGLGARLFDLQVIQHRYFTAAADAQRQRASELNPHRGTIYLSESGGKDDDLFPVATNQQGWFVYAVPRYITDPKSVADTLAPALLAYRQRQRTRTQEILQATGQFTGKQTSDINKNNDNDETEQIQGEEANQAENSDSELDIVRQELLQKLDQKTDPFEPIIRPYEIIDDQFHKFLQTHELSGIVLEEQEIRTYPEKTLAAHVLGYVGYEEKGRVGRYGVEGYWQKNLAGSLGFLSSERDVSGGIIGVGRRSFLPARQGDDVVLTIDRVVQSFIEEELEKGVKKFSAERGSIIVMNPKSGSILGMATYPTFDPNYYYAISDPRVQLNPIVSDIFEPGSIIKPVVMAAAIEEKIVGPETTMVDSGPVQVADRTINTFDGKHHGRQTMTQILEQSNNVGMVWVGQQLGARGQYDYFRRFGFGEQTGIELEGETRTVLPKPSEWNVTTVATASFGQGIAVTPLQAINATNAIANGGQLMQPYIVAERRPPNEEPIITSPESVRQVISSETADKMSAMMASVIENGVGQSARVKGYFLAGKTGTAQVPDERGKYSPDRKIISFVGFGPVEDPKFSILIKLDNPAGLSFASGTAAPMFKNIAEKLLQYYQIPPSFDDRPVIQTPSSSRPEA